MDIGFLEPQVNIYPICKCMLIESSYKEKKKREIKCGEECHHCIQRVRWNSLLNPDILVQVLSPNPPHNVIVYS
jgi:hypothetical protein